MLNLAKRINSIKNGSTSLGLEVGSTRIKAVLIDENHEVMEQGSFTWENQLIDGYWTYSLNEVWAGIQECYRDLKINVKKKYDVDLKRIGSIGVSGMMHGYLAFNKGEELLVPFRTWRNTTTMKASKILTSSFGFNIPLRWSVAHLYQSILNEEEHISNVDFFTTIAGYVHWKLTGEKVLGVGDASGMFPMDIEKHDYDTVMLNKFNELAKGEVKDIKELLPEVLVAGEKAGVLSEEGSLLLDPSGDLQVGIPLCPPEGDAGTGMIATNSIKKKTGNISAGTSIFGMIVLEKAIVGFNKDVDIVTTPNGSQVAMIHSNNCLSELDSWINMLIEFNNLVCSESTKSEIYQTLYNSSIIDTASTEGLMSYNFHSGEHITGVDEGLPMFFRTNKGKLNIPNMIRTQLYSACATIRIGLDLLRKDTGVEIDMFNGHGGFFKQPEVGQRIMSSALNTPITVNKTSSEGGPWGMAVLARYLLNKTNEPLDIYLDRIFKDEDISIVYPKIEDVNEYNHFLDRYKSSLNLYKEINNKTNEMEKEK